jgi:hypothetical protein
LRDIPGATLDAVNPPAALNGELPAPHAALEIKPKDRAFGGADAVTVLSHVALPAAVPAIAVFFPSLQHFRHDVFLFAPAEFPRKSRFATGHSTRVKAGLDRKDRFADKGIGHEFKMLPRCT